MDTSLSITLIFPVTYIVGILLLGVAMQPLNSLGQRTLYFASLSSHAHEKLGIGFAKLSPTAAFTSILEKKLEKCSRDENCFCQQQ